MSRTVSKSQTVYFHALNSGGQPLQTTDDIDWVGGEQETDTAHFDWDYCYDTDIDTHGLTAYLSYQTPGDRVVHLGVWDTDGDGYTDDTDKADSMTVKVTMTVETDWMNGYGLVSMDVFPGRWAGGGYSSVAIDGDHDSNCEYYEYLYDAFELDEDLEAYLDSYENQGCDLYLIGINKWHQGDSVLGWTWNGKYACICRGRNAGLGVELHEPACHDTTVGAIGHCTSGTCACHPNIGGSAFCTSCCTELKDHIKSHGP